MVDSEKKSNTNLIRSYDQQS